MAHLGEDATNPYNLSHVLMRHIKVKFIWCRYVNVEFQFLFEVGWALGGNLGHENMKQFILSSEELQEFPIL